MIRPQSRNQQRWGRSREMVVVALGNMTDPRTIGVLRALLADDVVAGNAITAIGRLGTREARVDVEPFLEHPKAWVRKKARQTLAKLEA